jgi:hypothetical protein
MPSFAHSCSSSLFQRFPSVIGRFHTLVSRQHQSSPIVIASLIGRVVNFESTLFAFPSKKPLKSPPFYPEPSYV